MKNIIIVVSIILLGIVLMLPSCSKEEETAQIPKPEIETTDVQPPKVDKKFPTAPNFRLPDSRGNTLSLADYHGKVVILDFWATWCGPCKLEMPAIQAAYQMHQEDGLVVLAIAVDDSVSNVRRFFDEYGLSFQPLMDDGTVSRAYQVFGLPTSVFIGSDGNITARHTGMLTEGKIQEYLKL